MFKIAELHPNPDNNGFQIVDKRTNRQVGNVCHKKEGGWDIYIRGQLIGTARITWQACYIADLYLASVGSPKKKRKK